MTISVVLPNSPVSNSHDNRPDPKPRKHPQLWQAYLWWYELMEMRKRHNLRISSIDRGKSNLDSQFEYDMLDIIQIDTLVKQTKTIMINYGTKVGLDLDSKEVSPIWQWITSIKGLGEGSLAAQLLSQIDDIDNSPTVASLWRYAGFAVIDGKAEKNSKGEKSKFNRKLKGICFNIADQFIKQQTPGYVDIYYAEKERLKTAYPAPICEGCQQLAEPFQKKVKGEIYTSYRCPDRNKDHKIKYGDAHIHNRAWRKMIKIFLKDLWIEWTKQ